MIAEKTNESSIAYFLLPDKVLEFISFNLDKNKDIIGSSKTKPINIVVENIKDTYSFTNINKGTSPLDGRNVTRKLKLIGNIILFDISWIGLPERPPFSSLLILRRFSRFLSEVLETIIISIFLSNNILATISICSSIAANTVADDVPDVSWVW